MGTIPQKYNMHYETPCDGTCRMDDCYKKKGECILDLSDKRNQRYYHLKPILNFLRVDNDISILFNRSSCLQSSLMNSG